MTTTSGKGDFDVPPNNWLSVLAVQLGSKDSNLNKYYLHLFTKKQPDLNWENLRCVMRYMMY